MKEEFTVTFLNRDFTYPNSRESLKFNVERFSTFNGSPHSAEIEVTGQESQIYRVLEMVRKPVIIYDPKGNAIWGGFVSDVLIEINGLRLGKTVDGMYNRIAVIYTDENGETQESPFVQHDESVAEYGTKEAIISITNASLQVAELKRDNQLLKSAYPVDMAELTSNFEPILTAKIYCSGWYKTLDWRIYKNEVGTVENDINTNAVRSVGKSPTISTNIEMGEGGWLEDTFGSPPLVLYSFATTFPEGFCPESTNIGTAIVFK